MSYTENKFKRTLRPVKWLLWAVIILQVGLIVFVLKLLDRFGMSLFN